MEKSRIERLKDAIAEAERFLERAKIAIEAIEKSFEEEKSLNFHRDIEPDVQRIIGLVQENREFFGGTRILGTSCIKAAADTLERVVSEATERRGLCGLNGLRLKAVR